MNRANVLRLTSSSGDEPNRAATPLITFRDTLWSICPPWLQTGTAQKILYAIAVQLDAAGDALVAGVKMRFPGLYSFDSLSELSRERRIRPGLNELDENFATRLTRWFDDHRRRGGPYALLTQLYYHYAPNCPRMTLEYRSGMRFDMAPDGTVTRSMPNKPNIAQWSRWVLMIWDVTVPPADVAVIPREWIAQHILGDVYVVPPGGELWDYPTDHVWDESGVWDTPDIVIQIPVNH